jgi:hypothetical protein
MTHSRWVPVASALALVVSAALACTGSSSSGTTAGCDALAACCASLSPALAPTCNAYVGTYGITDAECASDLASFQSAGECGTLGTQPGGPGSGTGGVTSPTLTGCAGLSACCPTLPVTEVPTECDAVASTGTAQACDESLTTYRQAGYCGGGAVTKPNLQGTGGGTTQTNTQCFTVESGGSLTECLATVQFGACEPHASVGPCPTDNLSGCCAYYGSSNADAQNNATCYYGLTSASYATISDDCTTGTWTTKLPSGSRWTTVPE